MERQSGRTSRDRQRCWRSRTMGRRQEPWPPGRTGWERARVTFGGNSAAEFAHRSAQAERIVPDQDSGVGARSGMKEGRVAETGRSLNGGAGFSNLEFAGSGRADSGRETKRKRRGGQLTP
jgi:hypothetical protein